MSLLSRCTVVLLFVGNVHVANAQRQNGIGLGVGVATPAGTLTKAFSLGSSVEAFGITKTWYDPVSLRLGLGYTWLPASTTWHLSVASVEPTVAYTLGALPLAPSIFGGPGWYSVAEKATETGSVNGVTVTPHSYRKAAFGRVVGAAVELTARGVTFPLAFKYHSIPGFRTGAGSPMKFNTFSIGLKF